MTRAKMLRSMGAGGTLVLALMLPPDARAEAAIYRCTGADGHVTFTDEPCAGGVRVDLRAGQADPAAIVRLRQDQEAFDRRDAQRQAALREAELRRLEFEARVWEANMRYRPVPVVDAGCAYCGGFGWYVPWVAPAKPPRHPPVKSLPPVRPSFLDFGKRR